MTDAIAFPDEIIRHTQNLMRSYQHWTGQALFDLSVTPEDLTQLVFDAPFVVISHGTESDPIYNYGNRAALELWEMSWADFTSMPSRCSAELAEQEERNQLLSRGSEKGFCYYSGVRISSSGRRFYIENGTLWNVLNPDNTYAGQAAMFSQWRYV